MTDLCTTCQGDLDDANWATCHVCSNRFHQSWDVDLPVPKCGGITAHEEAQAIVFLCNACFHFGSP